MTLLLLFLAFFGDTQVPTITAEELVQRTDRPMIVHVGFPLLFRGAHIMGSVFAGPGSKAAGIDDLKKLLAKERRDREIVLYCGCCPWDKCPNVRPAYAAVSRMGFTKVRVLMIPENMAKDWVDRGYPTQK